MNISCEVNKECTVVSCYNSLLILCGRYYDRQAETLSLLLFFLVEKNY